MKKYFALFSISILVGLGAIASAQSTGTENSQKSSPPPGSQKTMDDPSMQHEQMPGMDHSKMPGMQHDMGSMQQNRPGQQVDNPAERTPSGPPVPDLLKDVATRPPMQLNQFEQFVTSTNPTLGQANAIVRQSAAQARQVGLYPNPTVGYQGEQIRGGDYGGGEQGVFIQQNIVLGGKLGLRKNIYEQQRQVDQIGVTEQHYRILSDVGQSFYAALAAQEVVNARRRLLGLAMDMLETAHQLANVGQADAPDVLQSEVEAEQIKIDYFNAQRTYMQEFRTLAALVGKPDLPLAPLAGNLENPPSISEDQVIEQMIRDSPSVKRAQQDVMHAEAELKSAKREPVPDIQLRAGVEQNLERLTAGSPQTVGAQAFASVGVTLPLFNRNQGNVAAARADLERAQSEINRVQLSLRRSAQPLLQAYFSGQLTATRYKNEMIPRALQAYRLYLQKYQQMGAAYPQVLVSQRIYFQLQISYINVLQQLWINAIALQNYTLTDGLMAPTPFGTTSTTLNLPNASGAGAQ
jgi:cobalt-zinc-cadmium efflux system outer membrane protein